MKKDLAKRAAKEHVLREKLKDSVKIMKSALSEYEKLQSKRYVVPKKATVTVGKKHK